MQLNQPNDIGALPWVGNYAADKPLLELCDKFISGLSDPSLKAQAERLTSWYGMGEGEEQFIGLTDMAAWDAFYSDNQEAMDEIGDRETCLRLACNQSLIIGGGAAPLFRIGFVDE